MIRRISDFDSLSLESLNKIAKAISVENKGAIKLSDAEESGHFKKIAWGRYIESAFGMVPHNVHDDGQIWRVITGEDGNEYLVKETSDDDENDVKRVKLASITDEEPLKNSKEEYKKILKIIYEDNFDLLLDDVAQWAMNEENVQDKLNSKIIKYLDESIKVNLDKNAKLEIKKLFIHSASKNIVKNKKDVITMIQEFINNKKNNFNN